MARLIVVSNRLSLPGARGQRAGGLAIAMREALGWRGGMWFGWSGEITEQSSAEPRIVEDEKIAFATVDLSQADYDEYYLGYANGTLWPVLHYQLGMMEFHRNQFRGYMRVNAYLAKMLNSLLKPDDIIWVHDYHLIPLGMELRALGIKNRVGFFLHTPLPPPEVLVAMPHHETVMRALCAYDLIGFQTDRDVRAFEEYIVGEAGGILLADGLFSAFDATSRVAAFPIGIDTDVFADLAASVARSGETEKLRRSLSGRQLIVGVDRMDYSKGIQGRFEAVGGLLSERPEHRGKFIYLQIAPSSRVEISQYRDLRRELEHVVGRVNGEFADVDWTPIRFVARSYTRQALAGYFRISRIGLVTPLRDGMNLVAKEYVAAQDPEDPGVLILSRFAGAAAELQSALLVNPFDVEQLSVELHRGLTMTLDERRDRWEQMMSVIRRNTITSWRTDFIASLEERPRRLRSLSALSGKG